MKKRQNLTFIRVFIIFMLFTALGAPVCAQSSGRQRTSPLAAGIQLYSQGKWNEAVSELRRIHAETTSAEIRSEALFWISLTELSAGKYEEALRNMNALEEADPQYRRMRELSYQKGRALFHLGRYDEAIVLLKKYADSFTPAPGGALSPADASRKASALYWTGESLYSMGQLNRAGDTFKTIVDEYPGSPKYEASLYRLELINQKQVETELLALLKWSHEESLRNMEEFRRRESAYDQALGSYQKRIADMARDTRSQDLEEENIRYQEQLELAEAKIRALEKSLAESESYERLLSLRASAQELEKKIQGTPK